MRPTALVLALVAALTCTGTATSGASGALAGDGSRQVQQVRGVVGEVGEVGAARPGADPPRKISSQAVAPLGAPSPGDFAWPLPAPHHPVRPFQAPPTEYGPGHRGVDLAGAPGAPVRAAADGVVVYAGWVVDRNVVSIEHATGLRTTYEPVVPVVEAGQAVTGGQLIGHLAAGHPECAAAPPRACLHWGARTPSGYLDPLLLLGHRPVRLLPWRDPTGTT